MNKQPPFVQAVASALLVAVMLTVIHFSSGTHRGDPLVYVFIAVVAITAFILSFIRARAILQPDLHDEQGKFLQANWFLGLTFVALMAYGTAFSTLFTLDPGESPIHGLGLALAPSIVIVTMMYRRSRKIVNSFWPTVGMVVTIAIASAGVAWALERYV